MDLLQKFSGTSLIETYNEITAQDYDPFSYEGGNKGLDIMFEYSIGMCTYKKTIIKLEKELLFSQNHENSTEERYKEGLKKVDCYYLCAFANNVEVFRDAFLDDYLYDEDGHEKPTSENCYLLEKMETLHCSTLSNMKINYKEHFIIADSFFRTLRGVSSTFSKLMQNQNTENKFSSLQLKQISLCLCQALVKRQSVHMDTTPLTHYLVNHLIDQVIDFAKEKEKWTWMDNRYIPLPDDILFNHYHYPPKFNLCILNDSVITRAEQLEKSW